MEQKHIILSALSVGVGVGVGLGLSSGQRVSKWVSGDDRSPDEISEELIEQELMRQVVDGRNSKVTFEKFPYYISERTRVLLTNAAYVHLKHSDFSKHTRNLSPASRAILLSGPTELYHQMLAKALAHCFKSKLLLLDIPDFSLKMQSKYGFARKESSFKRSISEVTMERMSNLFGSFSMLSPSGDNRGTLHRQSSCMDIRSRSSESLNSPSTLRRNASTASDMSSLSSKCAPTNSGSLKHTSNWCFDEKIFLQSLYKVLVSKSETGSIILYVRDIEKLLLQSQRLYNLFHKMLKKLTGSVLVLGSRMLDPEDDCKEVDERLASLFPYNIEITPPEDENHLVSWKAQLEEDMKLIQFQDNKNHIAEVLAANDLECDDLASVCQTDTMILSNHIEEIVLSAISYHLMNNKDPEYRNGKLVISSQSLSHGFSIFQEGKTDGKDTLKLEKNAESSKDAEGEDGVNAKTESKSETAGPENKNEVEKSVSAGKKDGENAPPPKAPEVPPDNEFEKRIRPEVIPANEIGVTFADIGALNETKESLQELVMLPLRRPDLFKGGLLKPCRGILLFGPPGTGKTMLAKAIANEAGASFINVSMSTITSKWFGEDEKNVRALFTLAAKVSPTIIFVDEVDSMLGQRTRAGEHEAMRKIKNEFMTHWDGLLTKPGERILVLAATNRPFDLDEAIIRRFERRIMVGLPSVDSREMILRTLLAKEKVENIDYKELATMTEGYTGSDLKNLCITAAYRPVRRCRRRAFFGFRGDKVSALGTSNLSRHGGGGDGSSGSGSGGKKKEVGSNGRKMPLLDNATATGNWVDNGSNSDSMSTGSAPSRDQSPNVVAPSRLQNGESSSQAALTGRFESSCGPSGGVRSSDVCTPETSYDCDNPKESESPRFQAILRVTSAPRKKFPADIKSFSHELNSKGVRPFPFWKPRGLNNLEEILVVIRAKFDKAKEEVNSDLAIFAADLVGILEKNVDTHPEWQETIEDLLILARSCAMTSPGDFWLQCEGIVQELDDRRQELPPGTLKQLHTRMLFILTRCTRLLQFHKESGLAEDEHVLHLRQSRILHSAGKQIPPPLGRDSKDSNATKVSKAASARKSYSQEQHNMDWKKDHAAQAVNLFPPPADDNSKNLESPSSRDRMSSWKKLPSPAGKTMKETVRLKEQNDGKVEHPKTLNNKRGMSDGDLAAAKLPEPHVKDSHEHSFKHHHTISWGHWGDQQNVTDENSIICRICEEEVPTANVEDHSRICAIADRCDQQGSSVNERLMRIAETLEKMIETFAQKDIQHGAGSPDVAKVSNSSVTEESDVISPKLSDWSRRGSEDMLDCFPEADNYAFMDDLKSLPSMSCKTRFGPKSDQGMTTSSAGSMTPRSPLLTPRTSQIDLLLAGKGAYFEQDDLPQMNELADIARCVANTAMDDHRSNQYLLSCLEDLRIVIDRRKFDSLTVETFGARIEKMIREKFLQLCELVDDENVDITSTVIDEDAPLEDDVVRSLRTSPIHSSKDRTSIDDFEIIKPISRGAFGRVFLAKKRTTGDLFAIKVLKKADMIRKNAVESILAERDILISVRNPFVVRFFYSFTCRENLYLVMEYLNGGDLYSLLRNLGCLDEDVARVYIAEVVLALEYLHSLRVVHRDLKPDNLLIAHDGHIKLTDFGLSKVGLINSTDDLSGPAVSGTSLLGEDEPQLSVSEHQRERRKKRSAVGTPDYLAPEILLGTGHGTTADWWSVGVILFELIVGIPPFNAEHPQTIFDNILNRKIPWPRVPEEMSPEAHDLIDRLLTEDPNQRLGAGGASEVKQHVFFKDINWDTLARQKAAFVPTSESAFDTSYFTSRYSWNTTDDINYPASDFEDSSDADSLSGSSSCLSNRHDEVVDECGGLAEFESGSSVNYSFSNFSFKNLSQLASINYDLLSKGWKEDPPANS